MGEVAARLSDVVVATSDNPRGEDPDAIIDDVIVGGGRPVPFPRDSTARSPPRHHAMRSGRAERGDVVVIAGKGHETTQDLGHDVVDFDDRAVARDELARLEQDTLVISILLAAAVSTLVSLFGTRYLIVFFQTRGQGQPILGKEDHGPDHHMAKQGTPTMGGIAIVVAAFAGWLVAHVRPDLPFARQSLIVWVGRAVHGA